MASTHDATPPTMTALRAHVRGGPEQLVVEQAPRPAPGAGELLVEVHAAGITFAELGWDETWSRNGLDRTPVIPSHEFSGVVASRGPGTDDFSVSVGDEVMGLVPFDQNGAAAEFVVVPATHVGAKPPRLSHVEAASLPLAAATAWQALVRHASVEPGDRALVLGGAGAVGAFAVQIAVALGAQVSTTVLPSHLEFASRLGAHHLIDVTRQTADDDQPYDVVIDTVGGEALANSYALLRRGGRLVTLQAPPDQELVRQHEVAAVFFIVDADPETLGEISELAASGRLHIEIAATYPLADGQAAYLSGSRTPRSPGKTVLVVR